MEVGEEFDQSIAVSQKNFGDGAGLVWIGHKYLEKVKLTKEKQKYIRKSTIYLEHMKSFKLDIPALLPQHVHHQLEVVRIAYIPGHDVEVVSIQEKFTQQF